MTGLLVDRPTSMYFLAWKKLQRINGENIDDCYWGGEGGGSGGAGGGA